MKALMIFLVLLLAVPALAVPVDPMAPDGIAAGWFTEGNMWVLCTDGFVYLKYAYSTSWKFKEDQLPVPISEIVDWTPYFFLTSSGDLWEGVPDTNTDEWKILSPPVPCLEPIPEQKSSLGGVKGQYR